MLFRYFEFQLKHLVHLKKPLFLHNRAASNDLHEILSKYRNEILAGGVVSHIHVQNLEKSVNKNIAQ